jgi:hypothetical protein
MLLSFALSSAKGHELKVRYFVRRHAKLPAERLFIVPKAIQLCTQHTIPAALMISSCAATS